MNRRQLLIIGTALAVLPTGLLAAAGPVYVEYSRAAYDAALASGKPFMLDFFAPW